MKRLFQLFLASFLFLTFSQQDTIAQTPVFWKASEIIEPADLAKKINASAPGKKYAIFNIGPVEDILYARNIGALIEPGNEDKFKNALRYISKSTEIIFYCGCCAMDSCPNIEPAYKIVKNMGFKKIKILNIEDYLYGDWIAKGYPMPKK